MDIPERCVPEEFRKKVEAELQIAFERACETIGIKPYRKDRQGLDPTEQAKTRKPHVKPLRAMNKVCVECKGHLDGQTKGCKSCGTRHSARRYYAKKRASRA